MSTVALQFETAQFAPRPDRLAPRPRRWSGRRIALIVIGLWILTGVYLVPPDQQAVETLFGRVVAPRVMPGLHYALPWPMQTVTRLKVRQLRRLLIGGDLPDSILGRNQSVRSQFLTGDQNIINLRLAVQYSISIPSDYLFRIQDEPRLIGAAVEAEVARRVAHRSVDAVLTTEKLAIQDEVLAAAQKVLNDYGAGVQLSTINIETAAPPAETADAFRDVASARADTSRIISNAEGYANDLVPKARGQAQQMLEDSEAYKQRKINEAAGDTARFNQLSAEYAKAPEVTPRRLYIEATEQILPRIKKLIVDKNGKLDLTIIRSGEPSPKNQQ